MRKRKFLSIMGIFFAATFLLTSCSNQVDPLSPSANDPQQPTPVSNTRGGPPDFINLPGVVGVGNGLGPDGTPAVIVLTEVPGVRGIPGFVNGKPTIIKVTGKIYALPKPPDNPNKPDKPPKDPAVDPTSRFDRPVPIGVSTGHPSVTAGTIGARVTDGANVYILSNNHVYANEGAANLGDNVLQPGAYDGGEDPADAIGTLSDFVPINFDGSLNTVDAAIALTSTANVGNATPSGGYGTPQSTTITAEVGMTVMKYGRTTSFTKGRIYAIGATVTVNYSNEEAALFTDQIIITPGNFSAGGDSGSLIVVKGKGKNDPNDKRPVGLLFAGSDVVTIANDINKVLLEFGVTIDGK